MDELFKLLQKWPIVSFQSSGNTGKQNFIFKQSVYMERTYSQRISAQAWL